MPTRGLVTMHPCEAPVDGPAAGGKGLRAEMTLGADVQAYRIETTRTEDGTLTLDALPFRTGEQVEVVVLGPERQRGQDNRYPLRGMVCRYDRRFDPAVPSEDCEATR